MNVTDSGLNVTDSGLSVAGRSLNVTGHWVKCYREPFLNVTGSGMNVAGGVLNIACQAFECYSSAVLAFTGHRRFECHRQRFERYRAAAWMFQSRLTEDSGLNISDSSLHITAV